MAEKMEIRLTEMSRTSGWAAKIGPETLAQVLCDLPKVESEKLIIGLETSDDAAVYKMDDEKAIIQTLDFFTPIVDDPYMFGQIAAANSLSDVYAMGGEPVLALNIVCFPNCLDVSILSEIMRGGSDKAREAGVLVVGGHSVQDEEPKYGMSVMGVVHPERVLSNASAQEGDVLVLTKPLGLGILNTAIKAGILEQDLIDQAVHVMASLNKVAAKGMIEIGVHSCTDVTGFGLAGHAYEMAAGSDVTIVIYTSKLPIIGGAVENAQMGFVPEGAYKNKHYIGDKVRIEEGVPLHMQDIIFDPQTSGGLLISLAKDKVDELLDYYEEWLDTAFSVVGEVIEKQDTDLIIK